MLEDQVNSSIEVRPRWWELYSIARKMALQ